MVRNPSFKKKNQQQWSLSAADKLWTSNSALLLYLYDNLNIRICAVQGSFLI